MATVYLQSAVELDTKRFSKKITVVAWTLGSVFVTLQVYCWVMMGVYTLDLTKGEFIFAFLCVPEERVYKIWKIEFYTVLIFQIMVSSCMLAALWLIHKFIRTVI